MSPATALTRELFDRGRWALPAAALGALAFPVIVLSALAHDGALDPQDRSMLLMHLIMVQMNVLAFGAALIGIQWKLADLYAYPATTATLVTWRLLPAMVAMFLETLAWTAAVNGMFHLDWPLWGPALASAAAYALVTASLWYTQGSRWMIVAFTVVGSIFGLWNKSRYGSIIPDPSHMWNVVTPVDALTLLAFTAAAFWFAVIGVARTRRGDPPFTSGLFAWIERLLDRAPASPSRRFRSSAHAQFWYNWRHGLLAPFFEVALLLVGLIVWLFTDWNPQQLVFGVLTMAPLILGGSLVSGVTFGNLSPRGDLVIGQFLATRPSTTPQLAGSILRAAATSLILTWTLWALALAIAVGALAIFGDRPLLSCDFSDFDWRLLPAFIAGSWILMAGLISLCLTGRSQQIVQLFFVLFVGYISVMLLAKFALSPPAHRQVLHAVAAMTGVACLLITLAVFIAARRRGLIEPPTIWAAVAAWAVLVIAASLLTPHAAIASNTAYVFLFGGLSLAVLPFAAAPLALAWNRHR